MSAKARSFLIWGVVLTAMMVPAALPLTSPQLAWREPAYIIAGFAGVVSLAVLLLQPLLIGNRLPGLSVLVSRRAHQMVGVLLVLMLIIHVAGLWITSAPDVIDAFLFRSPTPFSVWGVVALWAVFASALSVAFRKGQWLRLRVWRTIHVVLACVIVVGSVVHALLIEGTMEPISKAVLCALLLLAMAHLLVTLWRRAKT